MSLQRVMASGRVKVNVLVLSASVRRLGKKNAVSLKFSRIAGSSLFLGADSFFDSMASSSSTASAEADSSATKATSSTSSSVTAMLYCATDRSTTAPTRPPFAIGII